MTLRTVAQRVGVSPMTVSNAFSRPDQLSEALRARILATAAELGYPGPDPTARALASGSTGTIGILLTDRLSDAFSDEMSTAFLVAVVDALTPTGLGLTLLPGTSDGDVLPARDVAMDGALVYSCRNGSTALDWLVRRGLPRVNIDRDPEPGVPSVNVDDRSGARLAARHLADLGHRHIGLVAVSSAVGPGGEILTGAAHEGSVARERRSGWTEVLDAAGARVVTVHRPATTQEDGYAAGRVLLDVTDRPTAVLCFSDAVAAGVIRAAEDLGLAVPDDVSVVGFDDVTLARRTRPPLTTVSQDPAAKAEAAVAALVAAIGGRRSRRGPAPDPESLSAPAQVLLPTRLVVRHSTAPPPG
ncbi:MAG: LacI family DNA-binding transcriptional regulator [Kineosporiaceae bacterium]